jgi:hypothetical protein
MSRAVRDGSIHEASFVGDAPAARRPLVKFRRTLTTFNTGLAQSLCACVQVADGELAPTALSAMASALSRWRVMVNGGTE